MVYSIEQLKGEVVSGGGITSANRYKVILPTTGMEGSSSQTMDVLCKNVNMPGRQMLTTDRVIGTINQKVVYGYASEEVNMTFIGLNDYAIRKYFEEWQWLAVNKDTNQLRYLNEYSRTVTIQQLNKAGETVYSVDLLKAYPIQILNLELSNEASNSVDIGVTLSYMKWRRSS